MNQFVFANNVQTTLAAPITSAAQTTIQLSSTANFPQIPQGYVWPLTLNDAATGGIYEIVYVTGYTGNALTVQRGQENTTARTWNTNDLAYSCATAGALASFLNAGNANFVQLNPPAQQSGAINVSGGVTAGGLGTFAGISAGGAISNATSGAFSGDVTALDFIASRGYSNLALASLPLRFNGWSSVIGVGPSSGLSSPQGVIASALAIGAVGTGRFVAIDTNANIGTPGIMYANEFVANYEVAAPQIFQNGRQVFDAVYSSTLNVTNNGHGVTIDIPNTGQIPVGGSFVNDGNGGYAAISLPNYGSWFVETFYGMTQSSNSNLTISFYLAGGTMTGGFLTNADATTAYNAVKWISLYGKGHTTVNNQTLTFALSVSGGSLDGANQPWTVRATRTA